MEHYDITHFLSLLFHRYRILSQWHFEACILLMILLLSKDNKPIPIYLIKWIRWMICSLLLPISTEKHLHHEYIWLYLNTLIDWTRISFCANCKMNSLSLYTHTLSFSISIQMCQTVVVFSFASFQNVVGINLISCVMISVTLLSIFCQFQMLQATFRWVDLFPFVCRLPSVSSILYLDKQKKMRCSFFFISKLLYRFLALPFTSCSFFSLLTLSLVYSGLCFIFIRFVSIALGSFLMIVN